MLTRVGSEPLVGIPKDDIDAIFHDSSQRATALSTRPLLKI